MRLGIRESICRTRRSVRKERESFGKWNFNGRKENCCLRFSAGPLLLHSSFLPPLFERKDYKLPERCKLQQKKKSKVANWHSFTCCQSKGCERPCFLFRLSLPFQQGPHDCRHRAPSSAFGHAHFWNRWLQRADKFSSSSLLCSMEVGNILPLPNCYCHHWLRQKQKEEREKDLFFPLQECRQRYLNFPHLSPFFCPKKVSKNLSEKETSSSGISS